MRMALLGIMVIGFVLLDIVVIIAMTNMIGWSSIPTDTLLWMLLTAIAAMAGGLLGLRRMHKPTLKS